MKNFTFQKRSKKMLLHQRVVWDQALHWGEKEKKIGVDEKKKKVIWEVIRVGERMAEPGDMPLMRVSMGLTDRRKTAKNLVDSRKNWKILTKSRK